MWIPREITPILRKLAAERPAVLVSGSRQSGKSSLLTNAFPGVNYVSLDLPREAERAERAGEDFLEEHAAPVIIDEVQYAPGLFRYLKHAIDADRDRPGRYLLTGSQKFSLMQGVTESLAGRVSIIELHSLALSEIEAARGAIHGQRALLDAMWKGGYPELHSRDLDPRRFYADYVATYLERDVRQAINVRSLRDFDRFLRLCATRTGQLVNMNALAGDVGISPNTVRSWLSVLEASSVVLLVPPYFRNLGKRLVKSPKLYFLDTGLACHLAGFNSGGELGTSALVGAFFETLVLGQLVRAYANRGLRSPLHFYRDHHGNEVDFLVPVGERAHLLECKWSQTASSPRGLRVVADALGTGNVISQTIVTSDARDSVARDGSSLRGPVDFDWLFAN